MKTFRDIALIWADRFPPEHPRQRTIIEKAISTVTLAVAMLSLSQIKDVIRKKSLKASHTFMDLYVIGWFTVLLVLLSRSSWLPTWAAIAIAAYRIVDIVNYRILFIFVKSEHKPWTAAVIRRSLAVVLTNFLEVVIGFAVLYSRTNSVIESGSTHALNSSLDALYFSFVTMTTVGFGDFVPATPTGRWLVMAQLLATIIFVLFLVPALISVFSERTSGTS